MQSFRNTAGFCRRYRGDLSLMNKSKYKVIPGYFNSEVYMSWWEDEKIRKEIQLEKIRLISVLDMERYNEMPLVTIIFEVSDILAKCIIEGKEKNQQELKRIKLYYGMSAQGIYDSFLREDDIAISLFKNKTYN